MTLGELLIDPELHSLDLRHEDMGDSCCQCGRVDSVRRNKENSPSQGTQDGYSQDSSGHRDSVCTGNY